MGWSSASECWIEASIELELFIHHYWTLDIRPRGGCLTEVKMGFVCKNWVKQDKQVRQRALSCCISMFFRLCACVWVVFVTFMLVSPTFQWSALSSGPTPLALGCQSTMINIQRNQWEVWISVSEYNLCEQTNGADRPQRDICSSTRCMEAWWWQINWLVNRLYRWVKYYLHNQPIGRN